MSRHARLGSTLLVIAVLAGAAGLALIKFRALEAAAAAALDQPEPIEAVSATVARPGLYQPTTSVIGTVLATRSVTLRNELPGTVHHVALEPGRIVEPGEILVALDVSVERAELAATEAEAALAESVLARTAALRSLGLAGLGRPGRLTRTGHGPIATLPGRRLQGFARLSNARRYALHSGRGSGCRTCTRAST